LGFIKYLESDRGVKIAAIVGTIAAILAGALQLISDGFGGVSDLAGVVFLLVTGLILGWLGFYTLRLCKSVDSVANKLKHRTVQSDVDAPEVVAKLARVVDEYIKQGCDEADELQQQIGQLQIQIQLSNRQKQNTEAIIYSISDAVIVVDESDRLLMANEAAGKLFSFDHKDSHLIPIHELIGHDKKEFIEFVHKIRNTKARSKRHELEFIENDRLHAYDCILSCIYDHRDMVCGIVAVLHDITREKEISQMKNDFVSHVSHELKTPLASITAYAEMLADGEANDEETREEFYSVIQNQANRLNRLIDDILNTARIDSGLIKIDKQPVSLTVLIEEQLAMIRGFAEEKNIEVVGQKPIVYDQVYVDRDMMSQVIVNLLSNAVKYTPEGGKVSIETEVDDSSNLVRVRVADNGVGIPAEDVDHVFDKFYRVGANKKQARGTGLGLNLVKQIIEKLHDGKVFVTSEVGRGSTFGFELPIAVSEPVGAKE
jgi:two-component system phosphate regulon sensor histidine kinase PhoR